jgi:hypothetical protein
MMEHKSFLESPNERLTQCLLNSAAGKGCFYIGLGGKNAVPSPSYEPYQCCPSKVTRGSKIAQASPTTTSARRLATSTSKLDKPSLKTTGKESSSRDDKASIDKGKSASSAKEKPEKSKKGKKSFFGSGKYTWWW